jgi:hypothetical protein
VAPDVALVVDRADRHIALGPRRDRVGLLGAGRGRIGHTAERFRVAEVGGGDRVARRDHLVALRGAAQQVVPGSGEGDARLRGVRAERGAGHRRVALVVAGVRLSWWKRGHDAGEHAGADVA